MEGLTLPSRHWRIIDEIRRLGAASRSQLVTTTGLSWGSVSSTVEELEARQFLTSPTKERQGRAGPESALLRLNPEAGYFLGVDIGSTTSKVHLIDFTFAARRLTVEPIETGGDLAALIRNLRALIGRVLDALPSEQLSVLWGIGLAWPGAVDHVRGIARFGPNLRVYSDLTVTDMLNTEQLERLRHSKIVVDHDTDCVAIAEKEVGNPGQRPRHEDHIACVTIGTGVGLGLVLDGRVYRGASNCAGEFGHIIVVHGEKAKECGCGRRGCLETEISGRALAEQWRRLGHEPLTGDRLAELAEAGHGARSKDAREVFDKLGQMLGGALSSVVNLLNPELIVMVGGVSGAYDLFYPSLRKALYETSWKYGLENLRIEHSRLGMDAAAAGAAISAYRELPRLAD